MQERTPSILERLEEQHRFPGPFMFKAIGPNTAAFVAQIAQAAATVLGADNVPELTTRESGGGKHTAVTLTAEVKRAEQVLEIFALMAKADGVKMVM